MHVNQNVVYILNIIKNVVTTHTKNLHIFVPLKKFNQLKLIKIKNPNKSYSNRIKLENSTFQMTIKNSTEIIVCRTVYLLGY